MKVTKGGMYFSSHKEALMSNVYNELKETVQYKQKCLYVLSTHFSSSSYV